MSDGVILRSAAHARVEQYMRDAAGSVFEMFDSLDIGWTHEDVLRYVENTPTWQALEAEGSAGKAIGMALAIAVLCVEQQRDRSGTRRERGTLY